MPDLKVGDSLTVVIVNWNGGELLLRCLASIRGSRTTFPVKVIIVDNNSSDGSREAVARLFPEYRIVNTGSNLGFARANNYARPLVDTPFVLFLNPDTELRPDTLERAMRTIIQRPEVGALGCRMVYPDGTIQSQGLQWFPRPWTVFVELVLPSWARRGAIARLLPQFDPCSSREVTKLYGGFLLVRRAAMDQAGWFDERYFMYAEDVDLSRTLLRLGWKLFYDAGFEIVHVCGGASRNVPREFPILMKQQSINLLVKKYYGPFAAWRHRFAVGLASLMRMVLLAVLWPLLRIADALPYDLKSDAQKNWLLLLWATGIRRALSHREDPVSNAKTAGREAVTQSA